jgi:hypothetical protein
MAEHLPGKYEVLSLNPRTAKIYYYTNQVCIFTIILRYYVTNACYIM